MADIKTRDTVKGTIRTLDKAKIASSRMKSAYIQTKDKAEHSTHSEEHSANEYATDRVESGTKRGVEETAHQTKKQLGNAKDGAKKVKDKVKNRIENRAMNKAENTAKDSAQNAAKKTAEKSIRNTSSKAYSGGRKSIRSVEKTSKTIKQSAHSAGTKTIRAAQKGTVKTVKTSVKTAEKTSKATIKTAKQTAKVAQKTAKASAKAAKRSAQAAKEAAKATAKAAKVAVKATIAAVKALVAGIKTLIAAIVAGGWVALIVIIVICFIGLILGSAFGIFASGEESDTGLTMRDAVQQINEDYEKKIEEIKSSNRYDILEMSGSRAKWKEVIAIYAVKKNMVSNNSEDNQEPEEVATMTEAKIQDLKFIFWEMNSISSRTEKKTVKETVDERQKNGKIKQVEKNVEKTILYITVSHRDLESMMNRNCFTDEQKKMCRELLKDENNALWSAVLNGIAYSDDQIVNVAIEQLGNVGGKPYWSWYGFSSRVEWCACFVSWCANECGYIETGVIPKYSICDTGVDWFKERN